MYRLKELDAETPGGVYLCQVDENVSCGACCGLYNLADASEKAIKNILAQRTTEFAELPRDMVSILAFKTETESRENQQRPYPEFHHCTFIGFIGPEYTRVGCLLHPLNEKNDGVDFRGLSYYGGMACQSYFCPTCRLVPKVYKEIVREVVSDWYLYGLAITEAKLLHSFFSLIERKIGHTLQLSDILAYNRRISAVTEFLQLRLNWPFRKSGTPVANYFFEDNLYPKPPVSRNGSLPENSLFANIFYELCSRFESKREIKEAEILLEEIISRI